MAAASWAHIHSYKDSSAAIAGAFCPNKFDATSDATNHPDGGAELRITLPTPRPPFHEELPRITSSDTKDPNREHDTSDQ